MIKKTIASAIALALVSGVANAEECKLDTSIPAMPDPKAATAEDRTATIKAIKAFQVELGEYRECLSARMENAELPDAVREAALDEYNKTVDQETAMVESWVAFNNAYQKVNS